MKRQYICTSIYHSNAVYREGLRHILGDSRFRVLRNAASPKESAAKWDDGSRAPRLVILGMECNDFDIGAEISACRVSQPRSRIVVLGDPVDSQQAVSALAAGADAYLDRSLAADVLLKSLELVMLGQNIVPASILNSMRSRATESVPSYRYDLLATSPSRLSSPENRPANGVASQQPCCFSSREAAVLSCLLNGASNKGIAKHLRLAEATVKVHVKAILRKLHVQNRTQAAMWAMHHNWSPSTARAADTNEDIRRKN